MDPVSAFASIVGLLGQFVSERRAASQRSAEEFQAWLTEHNHEEIVELISQSDRTVIAIRALLSEDRAELRTRLADIDRNLAILASANQTLAPLAAALVPGAELSQQAIDFLRRFVKSPSGRLFEKKRGMDGRLHLVELDAPAPVRGEVEYGDRRFYEDDVSTLVALGLITFDSNGDGERILCLTRAAVTFIEQLDRKL
jgi:molybdopterin converting factor small subunit